MFTKDLELKRGSTWTLAVKLSQVGGDWTGAVYRIDLRAQKEDASPLLSITPTATAQETDSMGRVSTVVSGTISASQTAALPLGIIYADLRIVSPTSLGTQFPVEWRINNVIQVTRS